MDSKKIISSVLIFTSAALACPMTSAASANYELRKRVIDLTDIMDRSNGSRYVSRAEFAAMLVRASEYRNTVSQTSNVAVFADVPAESKYAPHIRIAVKQGWMKGYLGGQFKPEDSITLQDGAKAVLALLGYTDEDFTGDLTGSRMATFNYLELNENLGNIQPQEVLTEDNCMNLFYNLLKTEPKGSQNIYGAIMDLTLSGDGEISPMEMLDTDVKGPYIVTKHKGISTQIPFSIDKASFFLDGEPCTRANIKTACDDAGYVIMYYNASSRTVWVYTEDGSEKTGQTLIRGEVTNIYYRSSDVMTPTAVTITTDDDDTFECRLTSSELQFAFSIYGTVEIGDDVILICSGSSEDEDGEVTYQVTDFLED